MCQINQRIINLNSEVWGKDFWISPKRKVMVRRAVRDPMNLLLKFLMLIKRVRYEMSHVSAVVTKMGWT